MVSLALLTARSGRTITTPSTDFLMKFIIIGDQI
jgi:hypothetical protein